VMRILFNAVSLFYMEFFLVVRWRSWDMFVNCWGLCHGLLRRLNWG